MRTKHRQIRAYVAALVGLVASPVFVAGAPPAGSRTTQTDPRVAQQQQLQQQQMLQQQQQQQLRQQQLQQQQQQLQQQQQQEQARQASAADSALLGPATGDATKARAELKNTARQVTFNGLPLYFFSGDKAVGDSNGVYTGWMAVKP